MMTGLAVVLAVFGGTLAWLAVRAVAAQARRRRRDAELRQIIALTETVTVGDWHRSVQQLTDALVQSGAAEAAVLLAVADTGALEHRASTSRSGARPWTPGAEEGIRQVLEQRQPVSLGADGVLLPALEEGELVGILALRGVQPGSQAGAVAARLAGVGLTGQRLYQKQALLSNTDGLTGLANHRHFQQSLSVALAQAYLANAPLALVLLDIDHFKTVNDTYGHLFGDLVLREIAYLLRRELPEEGVAARYGGEEFALVLQGDPARVAEAVAERIRAAVAEHQVFDFSSGTRLSVTISCGVARYELGQGKSRLVARADEALYQSKHAGRNRVTVAPAENSTSPAFPT